MKILEICKLLVAIQKIKYAGGGAQFEEAVKNKLIDFGFSDLSQTTLYKELEKEEKKKKKVRGENVGKPIKFSQSKHVENFLKKYVGPKNKHFVPQPTGPNAHPDYWIFIDGKKLQLECKSSTNGQIKWNSGRPRKDVIYAYNCAELNKTYLLMGQDFLGDGVDLDHFNDVLMPQFIDDRAIVNKRINDKLKKNGIDNFYLNFRFDWHTTKNYTLKNIYSRRKKLNVFEFVKRKIKCC